MTGLQQPKYNILPITWNKEEPLPWQRQQSLLQGLLRAPHDQSISAATHPQKYRGKGSGRVGVDGKN